MSNRVVDWFRSVHPDDTRQDDEITVEVAAESPDTFQLYPDAVADFDRINKDLQSRRHDLMKSLATPGDYVKQAAGSFVRGIANTVAGVPEGLAVLGSGIEDATGLPVSGVIVDMAKRAITGKKPSIDDLFATKIGRGIRKLGEKLSPDPVEGLDDSFAASTVPQALGSSVGFMAGGLAGKALKIPQALGIAGLGAMTSGADAWKEAKASGASDSDAYKVFLLNAGVGTSEVLPLSKMLRRLDGVSGGTFTKAIIEAGKESFEEALQEAGQQFAQNYVASKYYDKDRELLKDLGDNAAAGGVTGFLFSVVTQAIGAKIGKLKTLSKPAAELKAETISPAPLPGSNIPKVATTPGAADAGVDVRQNFVTEDDKQLVNELVQAEATGATGPEADALSAAVGTRMRSTPALLQYYTEQQAAVSPKAPISPTAETAPDSAVAEESHPAQTVLDEAQQHFETAQKARDNIAPSVVDAEGVNSANERNQEEAQQGQENGLLTEPPATVNPPPSDSRLTAARLAAARAGYDDESSTVAKEVGSGGTAASNKLTPVVGEIPAAPTPAKPATQPWQKLTPANGIAGHDLHGNAARTRDGAAADRRLNSADHPGLLT